MGARALLNPTAAKQAPAFSLLGAWIPADRCALSRRTRQIFNRLNWTPGAPCAARRPLGVGASTPLDPKCAAVATWCCTKLGAATSDPEVVRLGAPPFDPGRRPGQIQGPPPGQPLPLFAPLWRALAGLPRTPRPLPYPLEGSGGGARRHLCTALVCATTKPSTPLCPLWAGLWASAAHARAANSVCIPLGAGRSEPSAGGGRGGLTAARARAVTL